MQERKGKFYITTPIYYSNAPPHLGSAYTTLAADILARYHRQIGKKVFFLTGLDEHGAKIAAVAKKMNSSPQNFCDKIFFFYQKAWKKLNISNDGFIRTTDSKHEQVVQKVLKNFWQQNLVYKGKYQGFYCLGCEKFLTKNDLIEGRCPFHHKKAQFLREETYFFKLSQFQKTLIRKITTQEFQIIPKERRNEVISFLEKEKLKDLAISRKKVKWGIKLPFDSSHTVYVWIDAFLNYLTGIGWKGNLKVLPEFWPPDVQLIGKDILRVHGTIWPALLLALKIPLPKKLVVHGFFTIEGKKMSKSLGNVIDPINLSRKYGVESIRYFLFREIPFGQDGDFDCRKLEKRYNDDLAKGLGNLVGRILTLAEKFKSQIKNFSTFSLSLKKEIEQFKEKYQIVLNDFKFNEALMAIWDLISFGDKYIEQTKPWKRSSSQLQVIYNLLVILYQIAYLLDPFLPQTSKKIFNQLGARRKDKKLYFNVQKKEILFPRLKII